MALKFLNKKGWHTGSLRNIENVWKAEQKQEAEQKKLDELRKQIHEERERSEFRLLQEQAGLVPRQERLEFLYDSGLAVGKGNSSGSGFKALESSAQKTDSGSAPPSSSASSSKQQQSSAPGALFEEKSHSVNDTWRKLHSDPLLLIRQREQEALARVKNNPVQMAMIRKSVETTKSKEKMHGKDDDKGSRIKHHHFKRHKSLSSSKSHSNSAKTSSKGEERRKASHHEGLYSKSGSSATDTNDVDSERRRRSDKDFRHNERRGDLMDPVGRRHDGRWRKEVNHDDAGQEGSPPIYVDRKSQFDSSDTAERSRSLNKRRNPVKLSEEERAAKLREMQKDAELHEEQRWKRIKKADENDAQEAAVHSQSSRSRNFLDGVHKSIYGTDKGGSSTIEESVRRRTHYLQDRSESTDRNAFRR